MRVAALHATLLLGAALASGCTSRWAYETLQANQRQTCFQYVDSQRDRCLAAAEVTYDEYAAKR